MTKMISDFYVADKPAWMMLVSAILLSCAFLDSLVVVSQLSFANAISHLIVNAIMMIYCLSEVRTRIMSDALIDFIFLKRLTELLY